ncbi:MAG: hypothetical protein CFE29_03775 [Bradyrhizobiaceae bacterium PARB1]|jgi:hypothetical protein|nr:MAG: hypothetical protein CFE29_03775 [Bradyrhizobiaceae bacterium PARB1]
MVDSFTMQTGIHGRLAILNERHRLPEVFEKMRAGESTLSEYLDVVAAGSDVRMLLIKDVAKMFGLHHEEIADNADLVIVRVKTEPYGPDLFTVSEFEFCLPEGARS